MKNKTIQEPITVGQDTINVGDHVAYGTNMKAGKGTYIGYIDNRRRGRQARVARPYSKYYYAVKATGEKYNKKKHGMFPKWGTPEYDLFELKSKPAMGSVCVKSTNIVPIGIPQPDNLIYLLGID